MSSTNNEPAFQPFCKGNRVRHKSGIVGTVEACERRVVNGSTRWVVDIDPGNGEKIVQAWPHNCKLVKAAQTVDFPTVRYGCSTPASVGDMVCVRHSPTVYKVEEIVSAKEIRMRIPESSFPSVAFPALALEYVPTVAQSIPARPEWPKFFEPTDARGIMYRRRFVRPDSFGVWCDDSSIVDQTYEQALAAETDGTLVEVDENGVEIPKPEDVRAIPVRETVADVIERAEKKSVALPNGWRFDAYGNIIPRRWRRPSFAGYYEQRKPDGRIFIFSKNGSNLGTLAANDVSHCEEIRMEPEESTSSTQPDPNVAEAVDNLLVANLSSALVRALKFHAGGDEALRAEFARIIRADLAEHRPNNAEADLRERLEEATAEFARALSSAQSLTADVIGERDGARKSASGWRSVVVECEKILGMNGDTPTDPKTSAVPMRVRKLVEAVEAAKSRRDKVITLLQGGE